LVTGILVLSIQSASDSLRNAVDVAADLSKAIIALGGIVAAVVLVRFLLSPPRHQRLVSSTSSRYAANAGGTRSAEMGA
jgi:hypothetical protein